MRRVEDVYQVEAPDGSIVRIHADLEATADGIDRAGPEEAAATGNSWGRPCASTGGSGRC